MTEYHYRYGGKLYWADTPDADIYYNYNGAGQRVSRLHNNIYEQTDYYWNGMGVVNEYLTIYGSPQGWTKTYVGGLGERDEDATGDPYAFYFTDHLGSMLALYDEGDAMTGGIEYTAYGSPIAATGAADEVTRGVKLGFETRAGGHVIEPQMNADKRRRNQCSSAFICGLVT